MISLQSDASNNGIISQTMKASWAFISSGYQKIASILCITIILTTTTMKLWLHKMLLGGDALQTKLLHVMLHSLTRTLSSLGINDLAGSLSNTTPSNDNMFRIIDICLDVLTRLEDNHSYCTKRVQQHTYDTLYRVIAKAQQELRAHQRNIDASYPEQQFDRQQIKKRQQTTLANEKLLEQAFALDTSNLTRYSRHHAESFRLRSNIRNAETNKNKTSLTYLETLYSELHRQRSIGYVLAYTKPSRLFMLQERIESLKAREEFWICQLELMSVEYNREIKPQQNSSTSPYLLPLKRNFADKRARIKQILQIQRDIISINNEIHCNEEGPTQPNFSMIADHINYKAFSFRYNNIILPLDMYKQHMTREEFQIIDQFKEKALLLLHFNIIDPDMLLNDVEIA